MRIVYGCESFVFDKNVDILKKKTMLFTVDIIGAITLLLLFLPNFQSLRHYRVLFWIGFIYGSVWEFGFFFNGPEFGHMDVYYINPDAKWPFPMWMLPIFHSLWVICDSYIRI